MILTKSVYNEILIIGDRWKTTRKLMAPSFHFKTLEKRVEHVNKYCDRLFKLLDNQDNAVVDMYRYLRPYMFDIMCSKYILYSLYGST